MSLPAGNTDTALADAITAALGAIAGPGGWITDAAQIEPYLIEERRRFRGRCAGVVRPRTTQDVAAVVRLCAEARVPIVCQGGNTGLVGGGVPEGGIVLSTERLDRIRGLDAVNRTMTVEAGVILADVQRAADEAGLLFPLSLAAEGTCRIGGNLATNAGGITVVRYGNARELVLGLEVVLADGRIWDGLKALRKDNTGYDLKQLFIGAEGTLGVITAAVLKLFARPQAAETALVALPNADAAVALFYRCNAACGDTLTAFELIDRRALAFTCRHIPGCHDPFAAPYPFYVLLKLTSPRRAAPLRADLETVLAETLDDGTIADAVLATSEAQSHALWRLRESIPEAQKPEGGSIKNDVSVPLSRVPAFLQRATAAVEAAVPAARVVAFGHLGDGNIHFNVSQPEGADKDRFLAAWERIERIVSDIAHDLGGSFSAEHGIGRLKRDALARYTSAVELDLMRTIKRALDPHDIMNPGKVLPPGAS